VPHDACSNVITIAAVLITGGSGSGKTTVAAEFGRRGLSAIDADADESLARYVDRAGRVVRLPAAPDLRRLARHR
jgi:dephospho-CoA kinase